MDVACSEKAARAKERHHGYIKQYRSDPAYTAYENKAKVFRRIAKGSVPNSNSMTKYNITEKELNDLRADFGFPPVKKMMSLHLKNRTP
tara:strand:+ start:761 stop:1027 length:267 start_codon:yes stop_codon:yes gene_type:complete